MTTYRHFEYRVEQLVRVPASLRGAWRAHIRDLAGGDWHELCVLGNNEADAIKIAKQCIDYEYRVEVWEFLNERKYSPMKDGNISEFI